MKQKQKTESDEYNCVKTLEIYLFNAKYKNTIFNSWFPDHKQHLNVINIKMFLLYMIGKFLITNTHES